MRGLSDGAEPTIQERQLAKLERRDPMPNEQRVRVRVRTCSDSFIWAGEVMRPDTFEPDRDLPVRAGWYECDLFPSQVEALERLIAMHTPTADDVAAAMRDLRNHVSELFESVDRTPPRDLSPKALLEILSSEDLRGSTGRTYRPSWPASFQHATRRQFFPVLAVELVDTAPKPKPEKTAAAR